MDFHEGEYVLGIWYARKDKFGDVVASVKKVKGEWKVECVFRFNDGEKREKKFNVLPNSTEESLKERIDMLFSDFRSHYSDFYDYIDIRGDYHKALFKIAMTDWIKFNGLDQSVRI